RVDVDILVTAEGLRAIHGALNGLAYVPPFAGSKNLRDVETGVRIEFLVAGQFPGDGKSKSIAFPGPATVAVKKDGKGVSGRTGAGRRKDLADVQELIRAIGLDDRFAEQLNPYVRETYVELWRELQQAPPPK